MYKTHRKSAAEKPGCHSRGELRKSVNKEMSMSQCHAHKSTLFGQITHAALLLIPYLHPPHKGVKCQPGILVGLEADDGITQKREA